ncbi:MAG: response regulator transcription factor [Myxococcales bacterium]|nr:response regulator transcription factor [Myxococcales bacterium]
MMFADELHVLLVEDDVRLGEATRRYLASQSLAVDVVIDGAAVLRRFRERKYDAIVLDWMLPGCDGLTVCRALRQESDVPIVFATPRGALEDRIRALAAGADDYLTKPFSGRELAARIRAHARRAQGKLRSSASRKLRVGEIELDVALRTLRMGGREVTVTGYEANLLLLATPCAGVHVFDGLAANMGNGLVYRSGDRLADRRPPSINPTVVSTCPSNQR